MAQFVTPCYEFVQLSLECAACPAPFASDEAFYACGERKLDAQLAKSGPHPTSVAGQAPYSTPTEHLLTTKGHGTIQLN